jgi:hypothetical protein
MQDLLLRLSTCTSDEEGGRSMRESSSLMSSRREDGCGTSTKVYGVRERGEKEGGWMQIEVVGGERKVEMGTVDLEARRARVDGR